MGPLYRAQRRRQHEACGINSPPGLVETERWPSSVTSPQAMANPATAQSFWGRSVPLENTSDLPGTSTQDVSGDAEGQRQLGRVVARTKKELRNGGSRALHPVPVSPLPPSTSGGATEQTGKDGWLHRAGPGGLEEKRLPASSGM